MEKRKLFCEPVIEIDLFEEKICLYTSTTGDGGDVWQPFDNDWLD